MSDEPKGYRTDSGLGGDRTAQAVSRQLKGMGCDLYMIGVREADTGKMMNRVKTPAEIMEGLPWLKKMNANGNDIYVRPADDLGHGLVLVDDLDRAGLERMRGDGLGPAVVVETSGGNFQAWIKLAGGEVPAAVRGEVAKRLAKTYGADPASAGARHYGRLAGFINRKEKYVDPSSGRRPWVLCRESGGRQAAIGPDLTRQASVSPEAAAAARFPAGPPAKEGRRAAAGRDAVAAYRRAMAEVAAWCGGDVSRRDYNAVVKLTDLGFTAAEIAGAMVAVSPDLEERKRGHVEDYVDRTVRKAMAAAGSRPPAGRGPASE
jgi:hypothetical protein